MWEGLLHGSIVACLYAAGFSADEIYRIFKKYCKNIKYVDGIQIVKLILGLIFTGKIQIDGLNKGKSIEKLIHKVCNEKEICSISDIKKTLVIPSVNLCDGKLFCFTSKKVRQQFSDDIVFISDIDIGKAVRASCSYPVIFSPCKYNDTKLIDGGIRENVPWRELKMLGAEKVLNIMFEEKIDKDCNKNLIEVAGRSISLLSRELSNYEMEGADYTIYIKSNKINLLDMERVDELYYLGYSQTKEYIKENKILEKK